MLLAYVSGDMNYCIGKMFKKTNVKILFYFAEMPTMYLNKYKDIDINDVY